MDAAALENPTADASDAGDVADAGDAADAAPEELPEKELLPNCPASTESCPAQAEWVLRTLLKASDYGAGARFTALGGSAVRPHSLGRQPPRVFTLAGRELFTKRGKPRLMYQPSFFDGSPDDYRAVLARPVVPYKRAHYDVLGRLTLSINEDNTHSSISYRALSSDVCDEVDNGFSADGPCLPWTAHRAKSACCWIRNRRRPYIRSSRA